MFAVEMTVVGAIKTLLVSIPESVGVLAFGVLMIVVAVLIRRFLGSHRTEKSDNGVVRKA